MYGVAASRAKYVKWRSDAPRVQTAETKPALHSPVSRSRYNAPYGTCRVGHYVALREGNQLPCVSSSWPPRLGRWRPVTIQTADVVLDARAA